MKELNARMSTVRHELRNHIFYIDRLLEKRDYAALKEYAGKLLTNTIEGVAKAENAFLRVDVHPYKDYLMIVVKNTAARDVIKENPHLLTTKKDAENHGFGLKVVEQIADWYEGTLRMNR